MSAPGELRFERLSTSDQAAAVLRDRILRGELRPGTPLREVALASAFGISRNTLREAVRLLVYEGLVEHSLHQGAAVMALRREDVQDVYRTRRLLEPHGLEAVLAAGPESPHRAELASAVKAMTRALRQKDWVGSVEADMRFHRALVAGLGSDRLSAFHRKLLAELRLGLVLLDRADPEVARLRDAHEELLERIEEDRPEEAKASLARHLDESEARLLEIVDAA